MIRRRALGYLLAAGASIGALLAAPIAADASQATSNISGGSLAFVSPPGAVTFSKTLDGTNQVATTQQSFDVGDSTGSGSGWNITATSTPFATAVGTHVLATDSVSIGSAPTANCDALASCTVAANNSVTYPYTLPSDTVPPTASKMFTSDLDSGLGNQTLSPTWALALPANTYAGTYTATWTFSLVSGP
jgi:hypothetical protein